MNPIGFPRDGGRGTRGLATKKTLFSMLLSAAVSVSTLLTAPSARADDVFISDIGDNTVKRVNASSGAFLGTFVQSDAGLKGPLGMIFTDGQLFVVNQNALTQLRGEVFRFNANTGAPLPKLVSSTDPGSPYAPQGIVRGGPANLFYVADVGTDGGKCSNEGSVKTYDSTGQFMGNLDRSGFKPGFYPRGVVFGPDQLLYVAARGCPVANNPKEALLAYILRFEPSTGKFKDVFASDSTINGFHRPEGLVFDSGGNLWVTSFKDAGDQNDVDKILKLDRAGALVDSLPLWVPRTVRAYAQAIIFGPDGKLYVPISGPEEGPNAGQLRRCDTQTKTCDVIVKANMDGGPLVAPWFLIFKSSDPSTLNYRGQ